MRKWIAFVLLLLVGAEVFAQGSAPSPPQLWRRKGTADTSFVVIKTGDTVMVYDTAHYVKMSIRGSDEAWLIPDSMVGTTIVLTDRIISPVLQVGTGGGAGAIVFDNFALSSTFYSLLGNGLENTGGYLTVTIGASVEGSEVTNQTLTKSDVDTTATFPFGALYHKTTAVSDSEYKSKYYIDHNLFGYTVTGTPSNGQVAVYDGGTGGWTFGAGGSGSGDDIVFDQTLDNSNYTLGATTYTGGYINTSTVWMRGDTGINIVKSGQHPGDTMIFTPDWVRTMRNDGTQSIRVFRDAAGETMLRMEDSSIYTKMTTTNNGGWKFEAPVHVDANLILDGATRSVGGVWFMYGPDDAQPMYISDSSSLNLQTIHTDKPVVIGSSSNWTVRSDTIRASNGQILGIKYASIDTLHAHRELMRAGQFGILTSTDTALLYTRDSTNDTTTVRAVGKLVFTADAGRTRMMSPVQADSGVYLQYMPVDSASRVSVRGSSTGLTTLARANAGSDYTITFPNAGPSGRKVFGYESGAYGWILDSNSGTGAGNALWNQAGSADSNTLTGASSTILLDVHKNSTPSVVIGKGATMTSLIIGGNTSGLSSIDTSVLVYNRLYFGATVNKQTAIDSTFVYDQLKKHRYYFGPGDFWGSPEAYAVRYTFTSWNESDTTGTFPNSMYKRSSLFYARDTNGVNVLPYNFTWIAPSRDSLFSTVYTVKSGFTDVDSSSLYAAALYVNETKVDTLNPLKASVAYTIDSLNWTDRAIAAGDVVTVLLYFKLNPTAASKKRVDLKELYLNMRRY